MSEDIGLYDLLNLSIGAPHTGAVNFGALHALLYAVLRHLDIREIKTRWREDTPPVYPDTTPVGEIQGDTAGQEGQQPGNKPQEQRASSSSPTPSSTSSSPAADDQERLRSRIQTCEDDVSKAMKLIQELHNQKDSLKEEVKELRHQQKAVDAQADTVTAVEKCCHRVDAVEEAVRSLKDSFQKYPRPEVLSHYVTRDVVQSAQLSENENLHKDLVNAVSTLSSPQPLEDSGGTAAPSSPSISGQISSLQEVTDTRPATEAPSAPSGSPQQISSHPETAKALRNINTLKEKFNKLEYRVAALEEELITNKGSQEVLDNLMDELNQQRDLIDSLMSDQEKNVELVNDVQKAILQLQAECEKLNENTKCLHEDNRRKQTHIEELYKTTEELEEKKADKQMVESEIKADKSALDSKVSRLQFDSVTEQLNAMFHELLSKVTGQEQDWHKVIDKLSTEMECKLNRIELDSVKKQLEGRWKNIHEKLQAQGAPEHDDAAGLRKQLVDRFHCLSCDRPVVKYTPGPHLVKLPSSPAFPAHKSIRPFTVYALEQFRQHCRSERVSELTDYSHLSVSRSCGGSHTVTSISQRRTGLQSMKHHAQTEADSVTQSEEVDIVGLDGHIYKGRLNASATRNTETKLPTISTKDGMCKPKDKAKNSMSHKPSVSPEAGHGTPLHHAHSAKSTQCSRSASSLSGRDWPVSTLGCTSHSSFTQASATAESNVEAQANEPVNL